jgi:hypothetical protein
VLPTKALDSPSSRSSPGSRTRSLVETPIDSGIGLSIRIDNLRCAQHRYDDEVKDDAHGAFTPEMMKLPQATCIETFLEGVTDKSTGQPIFKELAWFTYKVSGRDSY